MSLSSTDFLRLYRTSKPCILKGARGRVATVLTARNGGHSRGHDLTTSFWPTRDQDPMQAHSDRFLPQKFIKIAVDRNDGAEYSPLALIDSPIKHTFQTTTNHPRQYPIIETTTRGGSALLSNRQFRQGLRRQHGCRRLQVPCSTLI